MVKKISELSVNDKFILNIGLTDIANTIIYEPNSQWKVLSFYSNEAEEDLAIVQNTTDNLIFHFYSGLEVCTQLQ